MRVPRTDGCFFQYGVKITNCFFVSIFFTRQKCDFLCVHSTHTVPRIDVLEFLTLRGPGGGVRGVWWASRWRVHAIFGSFSRVEPSASSRDDIGRQVRVVG